MVSRGLVAACAAAVVNGGLSRRHDNFRDNFRAHSARLRQQTIDAKHKRPPQPPQAKGRARDAQGVAAIVTGAARAFARSAGRARDAQGVAVIVTGAARAFARSAEIRDALKGFIVANGATPFFAVHLEDSCSGAKFYPGHQRRAPGEQRLHSGNPYANVSCLQWLAGHNATGLDVEAYLAETYPGAGLIHVSRESTCAEFDYKWACCATPGRGLRLEPRGMPALQYYWMHHCFAAVVARERERGKEFAWIARTRPDLYLVAPIQIGAPQGGAEPPREYRSGDWVNVTRGAGDCATLARKSGQPAEGDYEEGWDAFFFVPRSRADQFFAVAAFERECRRLRNTPSRRPLRIAKAFARKGPGARARGLLEAKKRSHRLPSRSHLATKERASILGAERRAPEYGWRRGLGCFRLRAFPIVQLYVTPEGPSFNCARAPGGMRRDCDARRAPFNMALDLAPAGGVVVTTL